MPGRTRELVSTRRFQFLWGATVAASFGDQCFAVALPWLVLQLGRSEAALGSVLMTAGLPRAALLLAGGALSDRVAPARVLAFARAGRACLLAVEAVLVVIGAAALWQLYPLAVIWGAFDAVHAPASSAIVPTASRPDQLNAANAFLKSTGQIGSLIAPAVAGVLIAIAGMGPTLAVSAAASAVAATLFVLLWRAGREPASAEGAPFGAPDRPPVSMTALMREWMGEPALRAYLVLIAGISLASVGPLAVGLPLLAQSRYQGSVSLGVMLSSTAAGTFAGAFIGGSRGRVRHRGAILLGTSALAGLLLLALAHAPTVAAASLAVAAMACASTFVAVIATSTLQARTDRAVLGRLMAVLSLASVGLAPVSYLLAGLLAAVDLRLMFIAASAVVVVTILQALATPALRRLD
jgi:MFS family permease